MYTFSEILHNNWEKKNFKNGKIYAKPVLTK